MSATLLAPSGLSRPRQRSSHASLLVDRSGLPLIPGRGRRTAPDAVIVPTTRPAACLDHLISLTADLGTPLFVLCSGPKTDPEQVAERMTRQLGARGIAARFDGPSSDSGFGTSSSRFAGPMGGRRSDLSAKRNAGLLMARHRGWQKVVFVDDDISLASADIPRMTRLLDESPVVGMQSRHYPDNSVMCHARRLAKLEQDVFVSGSTLGVRCESRDLAFFPDIYNEDWFFFGENAAGRGLRKAGEVQQTEYRPFRSPKRARHEEFGDLLAEGLYSLIHSSGLASFDQVVTEGSSERYWQDFIEARIDGIAVIRERLLRFENSPHCSPEVGEALRSLDEMDDRYATGSVTPTDCLAFLDAWRKDTADWHNDLPEPTPRASLADAMERLGIVEWQSVRMVDHGPTRSRSRLSQRPVSPLSGWTSPVGSNPTLV